jgi:hypothetical protein
VRVEVTAGVLYAVAAEVAGGLGSVDSVDVAEEVVADVVADAVAVNHRHSWQPTPG